MVTCVLLTLSCQLSKSENSDSFYAEPVPPRKQEFRWSNGKGPRSFDPALASAPPETDIVRAIFDGLTDLDPKTLREVPGIAEKWTASPDNRIWTFQLRKDAKWSNGEPITAADFVRSWKRLADLGDRVANRNLIANIGGFSKKEATVPPPVPESTREPSASEPSVPLQLLKRGQTAETLPENRRTEPHPEGADIDTQHPEENEKEKLGVEAVGQFELKVSLILPDKDLPKLVANPIFRPIYGDGKYFAEDPLAPDLVTSGPFRISSVSDDGIAVSRSDKYWNRANVELESVRFVPAQSAEKALDAYRSGDVDAVTNAELEPLALKLLSPYSDFRQTTHNALNFYEVNPARSPFADRRVREALAISIERDRLTESEMKGSTEPALHFLPYDASITNKLSQDNDRARKLLESAGFPNGDGFPVIRLVVNRNDTQLRIARSVMKMWKQNLNLDAELTVKETSDMEAVRLSGDYDVIRRGAVFRTVDKQVSFAELFPNEKKAEPEVRKEPTAPATQAGSKAGGPNDLNAREDQVAGIDGNSSMDLTDDTSLFDFRLIPLYFPVSYGLVKPYVQGFELNGLDAPDLKEVRIDSDWRPRSVN